MPYPLQALPPLPDPAVQPVMRVTEAAPYLGIESKAGAYRAVKTGALPTIKVSEHRVMVPTAALRRLLGLDGGEAA